MQYPLFLAQSDTTAGFLSKDRIRIIEAKKSDKNKPILEESSSIDILKNHSIRIPKGLNKMLRRKSQSTFIFPNNRAFRIVRESSHLAFLKRFGILYSSSANPSNQHFSYDFAFSKADVIIIDKRGIFESNPSSIFKVRKNKIKKIR